METLHIIAGGGLVLNQEEALLMIFRRGKWDLPKGKMDEGETIEQCALREVREETGLSNVRLGALAGITHHDYFDDKYTQKHISKETHWYMMRLTEPAILHLQHEEDIEDAQWCDKSSIEHNLQNSYANIIEIIKKAGLV